ncbi:MAG: PadR family transcriptional regulator [Candidatus Eremiobacteraeota bacterium]|nr:PadR family transcriptional regulator [Candidatus Eremiobacteraeota bacterium]
MRGSKNVKVVPAPAELNATAASLLGFLIEGPLTGYELASYIEDSIGNFWNVTRSQIYRELRALGDAGYVREGKAGARDRLPYTLTAAGRRAFDAWIAREPSQEINRFPLLLTLFFGDRLPPEDLARMLRAHRARHESNLAAYRSRLPDVEREYPFPARTMRFGLMYEEMILAWFATLEREGLLS